jgi:hypothetical protein
MHELRQAHWESNVSCASRVRSALHEGHALPLILEPERRVAAVLALILRGRQRRRVDDGDVPFCNGNPRLAGERGAVTRVAEEVPSKTGNRRARARHRAAHLMAPRRSTSRGRPQGPSLRFDSSSPAPGRTLPRKTAVDQHDLTFIRRPTRKRRPWSPASRPDTYLSGDRARPG